MRMHDRLRRFGFAAQDWRTFLRMAAGDPDRFQYKVVFGRAEDVAIEIRACTEE